MAKTGQSGSSDSSGSAAQRRALERQQRHRREEARASALNKGKKVQSRGPTMRRKDRTGLYMGIGVVTLLVAIVAAFIIVRNLPRTVPPAQQRTSADATVVSQLTNVPQSTWEKVGKGSVLKNSFTYQSGQPPLKVGGGGSGLPEFFYVGAEYCPYCGAQRWAMIAALSRFGTFSNLSEIQAAEYNIPTFSFHDSKYTSSYIEFIPKEIKGNVLNDDGTNYVDLDTLTPAQQQNFQKYDSGQNFPFVNIGNRYIAIGASYDFSILVDSKGNALAQQTIASSLGDPNSSFAQGILGTANYMTAGICSLTNQQPANVCNVPIIQQLQKDMSQTTSTTPTTTPATTPATTPGTTPAATPGATATPTKSAQVPGGSPLSAGIADRQAAQRRLPV
jgi:hypothetical protein